MVTELEELLLPDAGAWRGWLTRHHETSPGVWLVLHKAGGEVTALTYAAALQESLCFGWIDGQASKRDDGSYLVKMTPRRPRSVWSKRNVSHIARLEEEGRMNGAGRAAVEAAKADGRWDRAYDGQANTEVPDDLLEAIAAEPQAQAMFDVLTRTNRYAIVYRLNSVKRAETRARKITEFVAMLARHETIHPQKRKSG